MFKNKIMKKSIFVILTLILVVSSLVFADQEAIRVKINNEEIVFDVNPSIVEGRTVLPVRAIFEALGLEVGWDGDTKTVTGKNKDTMITLQIDDVNAIVNGEKIKLDVPAMIIDGRTMVPARFVAESTGSTVSWNGDTKTVLISESGKDEFDGYTLIEVDGGNLSGHREANVVVNIGFGEREYYAFTNEYGQLVKVTAKEIVIQDDESEPVLSTGRYYSDEAKVPGTESSTLDEGHVIADSLGGVSNAYNITPQESTLNRHGDQAYMEKSIRDANGCTDFVAIISYPDTKTQIPSHYSFTYTLKGNVINDEFNNVNPDEVNVKLEDTDVAEELIFKKINNGQIVITELDKEAEYIVIKNNSDVSVDLTEWKIISVRGNQTFIFPKLVLEPGSTTKIGDSDKNTDVDFHWLDGRGTWNNSESDPAELYNNKGEIKSTFNN